jgi:DNA-binding NarL/FixJ family response regulator
MPGMCAPAGPGHPELDQALRSNTIRPTATPQTPRSEATGNSGSSRSVNAIVAVARAKGQFSRVSDLGAFAVDVRRVAAGEVVIDPELVSRLVGRHRQRDPLAELTDREREVLAVLHFLRWQ